MCLWLLTACFGLLPSNQTPVIYVPAVPAPILLPTAAPSPTTTTAATTTKAPAPANMTMPPGNMTMPPGSTTMPPATTAVPTMAPTTTTTPATPAPTPAPTTAAPTAATPTTVAPTTAAPTTVAPTTAPPTTTAPTTAPQTTAAPTTAAPTTAAPATTGGELLSLVLCNDPDVVCIINPDETLRTGSLPIDPRLGTTPATSAAYQVPISGYSAQAPSYDTAVRFPRQRRNVPSVNAVNIKDFITQRIEKEHRILKRATTCSCVPTGTCKTNTNSGAGMIDIRIVTPVSQCPTGQEYCCVDMTATAAPVACGKVQTVPSTGVTPGAGQANFGEFPWQAIILTKQNDYLAGGVLIDSLNVLTVTHRLVSYVVSGTAPNVKVRLGEWDAAGTYEPVPFQEYNVQKVFTHPSYNANTLQYDITVLRLATAVPFTPATGAASTINRACLPPTATTVYNGQKCMVAGWGKNNFGVTGQYQQILKKVEVPIVAPATCQTQMQTARLGSGYVLDTTSFVCAGGEANKDACTGDGGSGLVCPVNGSWVVVGLVAWGLGCASANVPAAYVNVAGLLPWIQTQVAAA